MKVTTLQDRIEKAQSKIQKKEATIEKWKTYIQKKEELLKTKYGIWNWKEWESKRLWFNAGTDEEKREANNILWDLVIPIQNAEDSIITGNKQIAETQKTIEKYQKQLSGEVEKELQFIHEVPECMKQMEAELIRQWNSWDIETRNQLWKRSEEIGIEKLSQSILEFMDKTDEEINQENEQKAKFFVLDLYNRIKDVTGEVTEWDNIHYSKGALNGIVEGKEGTASVESILAGGYNIQRLHVRVLVHQI